MIEANLMARITIPDIPFVNPETISKIFREEVDKIKSEILQKYPGVLINFQYTLEGKI